MQVEGLSVNIKKAKGNKIRFIYHCREGCSKIVERYFFVKYLDKSGKPIGFWSHMNLHTNNSTEIKYMCSLPPGTSSIEMDGHAEDLEGHTSIDMKVLEL